MHANSNFFLKVSVQGSKYGTFQLNGTTEIVKDVFRNLELSRAISKLLV